MVYDIKKDLFIVSSASLASNVDFESITRLYQPIIGYKATALYLTFVSYCLRDEGTIFTHTQLFDVMQISSSDFTLARKTLESVGLIKTYKKQEEDYHKYNYVIYSPKSPSEFFADTLFKGLLVKYLGESEAIKIALSYKINLKLDGYEDVSTKFTEIFQPDLDDDCFDSMMPNNLKDTKAIKIDTEFSFTDFFNHLSTAMMISENAFSKKELNEIERIATLYGLDTITTCEVVTQSFDESKPKGNKVNLETLKERAISQAKYSIINRKNKENKVFVKISGKTKLADEINLMEVMAPARFLQMKQDNVPPVTADLNLINYLNSTMQLSKGAINALISYCLKMCNNRLNRNYVEKVAASLAREKVTNALDTLNYLENKTKKTANNKKAETKQTSEEKKQENFDEGNYNKLLESIRKRKK